MTASKPHNPPQTEVSPARGCGEHHIYRIFDKTILSQISLPELPLAARAEPSIKVESVEYGQINMSHFKICHTWRHSDGSQVTGYSARRGAEYLLRFPQQASFLIQPGGVIRCASEEGGTPELVRQLLLNQVLPRYLAHNGELLLHASAVTLPNGKTVAFLGESGRGKSTLASYCHRRGAHLIDDDCILLCFSDEGVDITGGVPTIRLYPDSLRALGHDDSAFRPYLGYSEKQQMRLPVDASADLAPRRLHALILLGDPLQIGSDDAVSVVPASGQEAVITAINSSFSLDPSDDETKARIFTQVGQLVSGHPGVYSLHYPRDHDSLAQVYEALLAVPLTEVV